MPYGSPFIYQPNISSNLIPTFEGFILDLWVELFSDNATLEGIQTSEAGDRHLLFWKPEQRDLLSKANQTVGQNLDLADGLIVVMAGTVVTTKPP